MVINRKAFTIIELLVVIGIISILAIALLVTLNPAAGQERTRDTKRMKDATTLQAIIESYLLDGGDPICTTVDTPCTSNTVATANSQACDANWLTASLCQYAQSIPADPINQVDRNCATETGTVADPDPVSDPTCDLLYYFAMVGSNYEINVRQESVDNVDKLVNDPGEDDSRFEIISNPQLSTPVISSPTETGT